MAYGSSGVLLAYYNPKKLEPYVNPQDARTEAVQMGINLTLAAGTILGQKTADKKFYPYLSGNSDGTQIPVGPLVYAIVTDANGNVILGNTGAVADLVHAFDPTAEIYVKGSFLESELTGLDANAVTKLGAHEIGIGANKYVVIPG